MNIFSSEIGIFSDPHYGIHRNSDMWLDIATEHARWAAKEFRNRGIKDIVIPGDVFHDRNDIAVVTLHRVSAIFDILKDFNIIITVGNHDAFYRDNSNIHSVSILSGHKNITVIDKLQILHAFNRDIAFCPWGQDISEVPECDLIFGHFEISSFKMNTYKVCTDGISAADLLSRARLIISGHFHHREERMYAEGKIVYAGCPYQQDWGDYETTKGLYILDLDTLKYEFITNSISPRHFKIKYTDIINKVYTVDELRKNISGNIVRLYVDQPVDPAVIDIILTKLSNAKPIELSTEYSYEETTMVSDAVKNIDFDISVERSITEFVDLLEIKHKDRVKKYVAELYQKTNK